MAEVNLAELRNRLAMKMEADESVQSAIRTQAWEKFAALGWPHAGTEDWKYTNLEKRWHHHLSAYCALKKDAEHYKDIDLQLIHGLRSTLLVYLNGQSCDGLSVIAEDPYAFSHGNPLHREQAAQRSPQMPRFVTPIAEQWNDEGTRIGKLSDIDQSAPYLLNTALAAEGAFISIPPGCTLEYPIQFAYISGVDGEEGAAFCRNLIEVGDGAHVQIIIRCHSEGEGQSSLNLVNEVWAGQDAKVEIYFLGDESAAAQTISQISISLAQGAFASVHTINAGSGLSRNDLQFRINGERAHADLFGLYIGDGEAHIDNQTLVDHAVPNCTSNELYKGILSGESTGIFNGKIIVRQDAQKTNAYQSNRNLLLSKRATVNTKPQLEIFADDVKCSHGATIGQLDEEAAFYLRSRGISAQNAQRMLTQAFAHEVVASIPLQFISHYIGEKLQAKLNGLAPAER